HPFPALAGVSLITEGTYQWLLGHVPACRSKLNTLTEEGRPSAKFSLQQHYNLAARSDLEVIDGMRRKLYRRHSERVCKSPDQAVVALLKRLNISPIMAIRMRVSLTRGFRS